LSDGNWLQIATSPGSKFKIKLLKINKEINLKNYLKKIDQR
jgi:hypothetical protein